MKKQTKDRPIYIPQPKRFLSLEKNAKDDAQFVELLGRYGRINHYEFEFSNDMDAASAASSYSRHGGFNHHGASLVGHVEVPADPMMSRRMITSRVMQADLIEKEEPKVRRRFLESHELLLPASKQSARWSTLEASQRGTEVMSSKRSPSSSRGKQSGSRKIIPKRERGFHPLKKNPTRNEKIGTKMRTKIREGQKMTLDKKEGSTASTGVVSDPHHTTSTSQNLQTSPEVHVSRHALGPVSFSGEACKTIPFTAFEKEIERRFPSCFSRRLLIAMWVSLCRSNLCFSSLSTPTKLCLEDSSQTTDQRGSSLSSSGSVMSFGDGISYFKSRLEHFSSQPIHTRTREASHFLCYLCIILGDIFRYRDIHESKQLQCYVKNGTLTSEEYKRKSGNLFHEAAEWYDQAAKHFPWESRIYTQLSDLYFRKTDILRQISSTLRSIVCAFRGHNEDVLTVLLETGSTSCSTVPFMPKLLSLVQSLYCKISLDQFDAKLESLCSSLKDETALSITSSLFDTLLNSFQLLVYLIIETSCLWKEDARLGDSVDSLVKSIQLKLVRLEDGQLDYHVDTSKCHYEELELTLSSYYEQMTLAYASAFSNNLDLVLDAIESGERFALTCIAFCRLANVVLNNIKSPLSLLLGVLNFIVLWLSHTGLLFLYEAPHCKSALQSNPLHEVLQKELQTFKRQFVCLLFEYGNELLRVKQLKYELLEYTLPEDEYLRGCIDLPVEFCIDPHQICCSRDDQPNQDEEFSATLIFPFLSDALVIQHGLCDGRSEKLPSFVCVSRLLCSGHEEQGQEAITASDVAYRVPHGWSAVEHRSSDLLMESESLRDKTTHRHHLIHEAFIQKVCSMDCPHEVSKQDTHEEQEEEQEESQHAEEDTTDSYTSKDSQETEGLDSASSASVLSGGIKGDHQDTKPPQEVALAREATDKPSDHEDTRADLQVSSTSLSRTSSPGPQESFGKHYHVKAVKPSCHQKSFTRLCRLLLVAVSLDEFHRYCEEKKQMILKKIHDGEDKPCEDIKDNDMKRLDTAQEKGASGLGNHEAPGGLPVSQDRRGLLKINPASLPKPTESKVMEGQKRLPRKHTKCYALHESQTSAKSRLFSTGCETTSHLIQGGNPRPVARVPYSAMTQAKASSPDSCVVLDAAASMIVSNHHTPTLSVQPKRTLIVIDGSNVALRHGSGKEKKFSSLGIKIVLDYFLFRNFNAIAFVPEYLTNFKDVGDNVRLRNANIGKNKATKIPDNVQLLRDLSGQGLLITTPPQDYDDSYIIQYAMNHEGYIVSNDRYRDHGGKEPRHVRQWLRIHLISFTFVNDEFMPNPDFVFPQDSASQL